MPATKEELEKREQEMKEEEAITKKQILIILRESHPNFLSQAEIEKRRIDKKGFNPLWQVRFLKIFVIRVNIQRCFKVRNALDILVQEGKIIEKLEMYGLN